MLPQFVCCVCHKLLFKNSVKLCNRTKYLKMSEADLAMCISEKYLHKCNSTCPRPCMLFVTRGDLNICHSCDGKMLRGRVPAECAANNLELPPIPEELKGLNSLETHLISPNIMFYKYLALPTTKQSAIRGPVVCVENHLRAVCAALLPRTDSPGLLRVKLKRKASYKGHYEYQFVDTQKLKTCLGWLKTYNKQFEGINFNDEWINDFARPEQDPAEEEEEEGAEGEQPPGGASAAAPAPSTAEAAAAEEEHLYDKQQHGVFNDTCSMPLDMGQEALDQYLDNVVSVAPAEGNNPIARLNDRTNEARCFPTIFVTGTNTFHTPRKQPLTLCKYFKLRLLNADPRCANNLEYLFYADSTLILYNVISTVSIATRKGYFDVTQGDSVRHVVQFNAGFRFLSPVLGSPSSWARAKSDLFAMIRQLGVPTWFCSFSAADLRWPSLLEACLIQEGRSQSVEELTWAERCALLRNNPVLAARMFQQRWECFMRIVLRSPANPLGKIIDHFARVEFQMRGSPHIHALLWVENAPRLDQNPDEEVIGFVDNHITCQLPKDDPQLLELVKTLQSHSKRHSKTCRKKKTVCRFNFPRPPSQRTFIKRAHQTPVCPKCHLKQQEADCVCPPDNPDRMSQERAQQIMSQYKEACLDEVNPPANVADLFGRVGITQDILEEAFEVLGGHTSIILKRELDESWINQGNWFLLLCWEANIDIQYVVDPYACAVYIVTYISKSEREVGQLLSAAQKEALEGNESAKDAMKKMGSVYLNNREVSAQEAAYRVTGMPLKDFSRKVCFIPTGNNIVRLSKPIQQLENASPDDVWMNNIIDRYMNRPNDSTFHDMCIAVFVSDYRILFKGQTSRRPILLQNSMGAITKRVNSKPAIIRYARFSPTQQPELFHQSILQLFLPYRTERDLLPAPYASFEAFYNTGKIVLCDGSESSVKAVVDANRHIFDRHTDDLEAVESNVNNHANLEDAWCALCPGQQLERLEDMEDGVERPQEEEDDATFAAIPELAIRKESIQYLEKANTMTRQEGLDLIRTLNPQQMAILHKMRLWCLQHSAGQNPDPLYTFITGGAGTGKSHLIRAIQYEATRLLAPSCSTPEAVSVLLTAPTGIAAYNLKATTIHSTFSIGLDASLPYVPLGEEKVNALRAQFADVRLIIIDEISMVSYKILVYIHGRLRQIKQSGEAPFGNLCVIAVGDFFQLPPVRGRALYEERAGFDLWNDLFRVAELTTVVRQQDTTFADLLNRLRTRSKEAPMLPEDDMILRSRTRREDGQSSSALHIFPTKPQVRRHNEQQLAITCPDHITVRAQDYSYSKKTGKLIEFADGVVRAGQTSLPDDLTVGLGARVMLIKNLDLGDGLVNGLCGTVTYIDNPANGRLPLAIYVQFDDTAVGAQRRSSTLAAPNLSGSTRIEPTEERANRKNEKRRQFPLTLAWACTVHKVQGLTVDEAVVGLNHTFTAGQAYVALSRVRRLEGLIIHNFKPDKIYCNDKVRPALDKMPRLMSLPTHETHAFCLFFMNVQGLPNHVSDLQQCLRPFQPACIAITETWLTTQSQEDAYTLDGYRFHSQPRSLAYRASRHPTLAALQAKQHGGVGMYCQEGHSYSLVSLPPFHLECLAQHFTHLNILVAVIYRPPSYPLPLFKEHLQTLVTWLESRFSTIAIVGDFNDDILKSSSVCTFMEQQGFLQCVTSATTERATLLDHMYLKSSRYEVDTCVVSAYFSDHEGVACCFKQKDFCTDT